MIKGFRVVLSSAELKEHLEVRVKHHNSRAEWYEQQKEQFADTPVANVSNDPIQGLKDAAKKHREQASLFAFYAAHVPAGETYELDNHELGSLELIPSRW